MNQHFACMYIYAPCAHRMPEEIKRGHQSWGYEWLTVMRSLGTQLILCKNTKPSLPPFEPSGYSSLTRI